MEPKEYRLDPAGFVKVRNGILLRTIPMIVLIFVGVTWFQERRSGPTPVGVSVLGLLIGGAAAAYGLSLGIRKQRTAWEGWTLQLGEADIVLRRPELPEFRVGRSELRSIRELPDGALHVEGADAKRRIEILAAVTGLAEIREVLARWKDIEPAGSSAVSGAMRWALALGGLACYGLSMYSQDRKVVLGAGTVAVPILAWSVYDTLTNPNIEPKTRRVAWMFVAIIGSLVIRMIKFYGATT